MFLSVSSPPLERGRRWCLLNPLGIFKRLFRQLMKRRSFFKRLRCERVTVTPFSLCLVMRVLVLVVRQHHKAVGHWRCDCSARSPPCSHEYRKVHHLRSRLVGYSTNICSLYRSCYVLFVDYYTEPPTRHVRGNLRTPIFSYRGFDIIMLLIE